MFLPLSISACCCRRLCVPALSERRNSAEQPAAQKLGFIPTLAPVARVSGRLRFVSAQRADSDSHSCSRNLKYDDKQNGRKVAASLTTEVGGSPCGRGRGGGGHHEFTLTVKGKPAEKWSDMFFFVTVPVWTRALCKRVMSLKIAALIWEVSGKASSPLDSTRVLKFLIVSSVFSPSLVVSYSYNTTLPMLCLFSHSR